MRNIDADVFKAEWGLGDKCEKCEADPSVCAKKYYTKKELCEMIDDAPTVETKDTVVKCAECIHWNETAIVGGETMDVPGVRYCELMEKNLFEWDYCSYATKRAEGEKDA